MRPMTDGERWKSATPALSVHNVDDDSRPRPQSLPPNLLQGLELI